MKEYADSTYITVWETLKMCNIPLKVRWHQERAIYFAVYSQLK